MQDPAIERQNALQEALIENSNNNTNKEYINLDIENINDLNDNKYYISKIFKRNQQVNICDIYYYYHGKGFTTIVLSRFIYFLMVAFGMALSSLLLFFMNYRLLGRIYISVERCVHYPTGTRHTLFVFSNYLFGFILFIIIIYSLRDIYSLWVIRQFYQKRLSIIDSDLDTMPWSDVCKRLQIHCRDMDHITVENISHAVMRRDNYLIAISNCRIFDGAEVPPPWINHIYDIMHSTLFYSKTFDWIFDNIIFPTIIPNDYQISINNMYNLPNEDPITWNVISSGVSDDNIELQEIKKQEMIIHHDPFLEKIKKAGYREDCAERLSFKLKMIGLISIPLVPIIFATIIIYSFFRYTEELKNQPENTLASRQWSKYTRYKYRRYNELPHDFEYRLNSSMQSADLYLKQFFDSRKVIIIRLLIFILAAILAVILAMAFIDEQLLLYKEFYGKTLIWWLTIVGGSLTFFRHLTPPRHSYFDPWTHMELLCHKIGFPDSWKDKAHDLSLRSNISHYYPHRIVIYFHELLAVIMMPYICGILLPRYSKKLTAEITELTSMHYHVGPVCKLSVLNKSLDP